MRKIKNISKYLKDFIPILNGEKFAYIYVNGKRTEYVVSSRGYVISLNYRSTGKPAILNSENNHGYRRVTLFIDGKKVHKRIHRLVAEAFLPNENNCPYILHLDNDKTHNYVENLKWGTPADNSKQAIEDGLIKHGEESPRATVSNKTVHKICKELEKNKLTIPKIAEKYNVTQSVVSLIRLGYDWTHISKDYDLTKYNLRCVDCKLPDIVVQLVCELLQSGEFTNKEIAQIIDSPSYVVNDIHRRKTYRSISKNYNW